MTSGRYYVKFCAGFYLIIDSLDESVLRRHSIAKVGACESAEAYVRQLNGSEEE